MWVIYVGALTGILVLFWASRSTKADANADAPVFVRIFSGRQYGFAPVSKNR